MSSSHSHHAAVTLDTPAHAVLTNGLRRLIALTEGLAYRPLNSAKHPLPLAHVSHATLPDPARVRQDVAARLESDPVAALPHALALLELYECNQPDIQDYTLADMPFVGACFNSKRCNGWLATTGDGDREAVQAAIGDRWQFKFFDGPSRETGIYLLLNMLARYAYVYGRIAYGDDHGVGHFVEDHCPGLLLAYGNLTDLELTLSLAAMKMGVPAIVPPDYPFPLGRTVRTADLAEITEAVVGFPNIRKLLNTPELPRLPGYCDPAYRDEKVEPGDIWGDADDSFYLLRKGEVRTPGVTVSGVPGPALGVLITVQGEPLDAFDCRYIERQIIGALSLMPGVAGNYEAGRLVVRQAPGAALDPARIGEVLLASLGREFPRLGRTRAEIIFDAAMLSELGPEVRAAREARDLGILEATEEEAPEFYACVACSPFAPDHVCILTPERPPQCGRPYEMIKTGALYGHDDMSNIHHSRLHRELNSFRVLPKGVCLDATLGEWSGINAGAAELTHGRTPRVCLHTLDGAPHTGCGCFRLIMFETDQPRPGIGIMEAGYDGASPDGRGWADLHYALAGKQSPGLAGAPPAYLRSPKFLRAHGGWASVVWVSPRIAEIMGADLPESVTVG